MRNKNKLMIVILFLIVVGIAITLMLRKQPNSDGEVTRELSPTIGAMQRVISTTGIVYPKNRLQIKPPVNGRIESIAVKEGDMVTIGQPLAMMSSTERAALLDAARGQGDEQLKYWKEAYKAIQLFSPIDGEVIVATTQPGQTVTASDAVVVLSDALIVRAQVDETDIGRVKVGQSAIVSLDAYPDVLIKAQVDHIYYESETVNNVTIYKVDLVPEEQSQALRSGMNASIDFIIERKDAVVIVPLDMVTTNTDGSFVLVKRGNGDEPERRTVQLGIENDKNAEIVSGLTSHDTIVATSKKYILPGKDAVGKNPFMPKMPTTKRGSAAAK